MCRGSEAGSYLRLIDSCITQLKAQGHSRTCNESKEGEEAQVTDNAINSLLCGALVVARLARYIYIYIYIYIYTYIHRERERERERERREGCFVQEVQLRGATQDPNL